jgi:PAS domain S-box-containing protein
LLFAETDRLISTTLHDRSIPAEISKSSPDPSRKIKIGAASYIGDSIEINILEEYRLLGLLDIDPYLANTRQFRNLITLNLVGVSLVGAGVAVLVARRISNPLNQLAKSASALREGDLATPLTTPADVWEINQLSNALEDARVSLKHSLDQLRQEKLWIENLMNSMVECLLTIDDQGRITFVSRPIEKIMGIEPILLLGKHLDEIFIITQGENLFSQQLPGENQTRRIPVIVDDSEILLSVSTSTVLPVESGNATRALMLRDVTDEERIHRLVGEFMANITHEFRTPLSALAASVELLRDALPDLSVEEMRQLLEALNLGIIDLQSLIDNLIEASSIEAGRFKVNPEKVELSTIIDHAINTVQPLLQKKGLQLQMPKSRPAFRVRADQRRTAQALINLLSNAIKHSPEGGRVSLRKLMMEGEVLIEIQDEGSGIQPEYQDRLFKRFVPHQSSQDLSTMGMGLGLSVVKAVIEAQGGKVGFRNHAGGGAIFWFTLETVPEDVS